MGVRDVALVMGSVIVTMWFATAALESANLALSVVKLWWLHAFFDMLFELAVLCEGIFLASLAASQGWSGWPFYQKAFGGVGLVYIAWIAYARKKVDNWIDNSGDSGGPDDAGGHGDGGNGGGNGGGLLAGATLRGAFTPLSSRRPVVLAILRSRARQAVTSEVQAR